MSPRIIADCVLILHTLFVAVVVFSVPLIIMGGALGWRWVRSRAFRFTHLGMIAFVAGESLLGVYCPLTILEDRLRAAAGQEGNNGDFIATWLDRLMFLHFPHWVFTAAYVSYGLIVASLFYVVPVRFTEKPSDITP